MLKIKVHGFEKLNLIDELVNEFLPKTEYEFTVNQDFDVEVNKKLSRITDDVKREIFVILSNITGNSPDWGILTGVRPVKLAGELYNKFNNKNDTVNHLTNRYMLSHEKANLIVDMYLYQMRTCGIPKGNSVSLYIGIPFCPTRCSYCSFASNQVSSDEMDRYLKALFIEIDWVASRLERLGNHPESIYIGGGTPTALNHKQLDDLLEKVSRSFDVNSVKEYAIEAGRPDTIDENNLGIIKKYGVDRISINPQSMKEKTLKLIGRSHTADDIRRAFEQAKMIGFKSINADLIAGLPDEDIDDFMGSLGEVRTLGADNITVHSLAVKRASKLREDSPEYHHERASVTKEMTKAAFESLKLKGYKPYYLYRQKHMAGAGENIGYCTDDKVGIYNIRVMDEHQSVIALGAGGISKKFYSSENRLERIVNVTNYEQYIDRIEEMISRKDRYFI